MIPKGSQKTHKMKEKPKGRMFFLFAVSVTDIETMMKNYKHGHVSQLGLP